MAVNPAAAQAPVTQAAQLPKAPEVAKGDSRFNKYVNWIDANTFRDVKSVKDTFTTEKNDGYFSTALKVVGMAIASIILLPVALLVSAYGYVKSSLCNKKVAQGPVNSQAPPKTADQAATQQKTEFEKKEAADSKPVVLDTKAKELADEAAAAVAAKADQKPVDDAQEETI